MGLFDSMKGALVGGALGGMPGALLGGSSKARQAVGLEQSAAEKEAHEEAKRYMDEIRATGQRRGEVSAARNALLGKKREEQKRLEAGEPLRKQKLMEREADIARRDLASKLKQTRAGAQSRGLLYSGLGQKAEQDQMAENAQMLGERQQDVAQKSYGLLRGLEDASLQDALDTATLQQQEQLADLGQYQQDMTRQFAEQQARAQALGDIGESVGGLIGTYYGKKPKTTVLTEDQKNINRIQAANSGYGRPD